MDVKIPSRNLLLKTHNRHEEIFKSISPHAAREIAEFRLRAILNNAEMVGVENEQV
jgi:hypothetical protein